jgi:carbonic anhydrase
LPSSQQISPVSQSSSVTHAQAALGTTTTASTQSARSTQLTKSRMLHPYSDARTTVNGDERRTGRFTPSRGSFGSVQKLARGVHQFQAKYFHQHRALFRELAQGQRPETLFITCSDSRVVPHLITSTQPGELFLVRNIGNVVPHPSLPGGTSAAIQYAVEVLGVENVVICGHTLCGAMQAILDPESVAKMEYVKRWIDQSDRVRDIVKERYAHLEGQQRVNAAAQENVLVQLEHLREYPFVAERLDAGKLHVAGWVFKIDTGAVFEFDADREEFVPIRETA